MNSNCDTIVVPQEVLMEFISVVFDRCGICEEKEEAVRPFGSLRIQNVPMLNVLN